MNTRGGRSRWVGVARVGLLALLVAGGCQSTGSTTAPERPRPSAASLIEAHNARVDQLRRVTSRGVIELNWTDDRGRHREQGDLDLYIELPRNTAFRVSKVGETYFWFGSDAQQYWVFDLSNRDQRTLHVDAHGQTGSLHDEAAIVEPLALLDLMGLSRIVSTTDHPDAATGYSEAFDAWIVTGRGEGGLVRLFINRHRRLPSRIELLSAADEAEPVAYSRIYMDRYRSVPVAGAPQASWPHIATNVDVILATEEEEENAGFLKIALGEPTTIVDDAAFDRVFDLDRLKRAHRPDRIESGRGVMPGDS